MFHSIDQDIKAQRLHYLIQSHTFHRFQNLSIGISDLKVQAAESVTSTLEVLENSSSHAN